MEMLSWCGSEEIDQHVAVTDVLSVIPKQKKL